MPGKSELIGVYKLPVTNELSAAQVEMLYGDAPSSEQRARARHQLESTVLVEVLISDADADFNVADFTQEHPRLPRTNWQVAWAEAFLSTDGLQLLVERWEPLPRSQATFRVAFFIHDWQEGQRLLSSYGDLPGAQPTPMPDRLLQLVPYEMLD